MSIDRNIQEAKSKYRFSSAEDCKTPDERIAFCKAYLTEFSDYHEKEKKLAEPIPEVSFKPKVSFNTNIHGMTNPSYNTLTYNRVYSKGELEHIREAGAGDMIIQELQRGLLDVIIKSGMIQYEEIEDYTSWSVREVAKIAVTPFPRPRLRGTQTFSPISIRV